MVGNRCADRFDNSRFLFAAENIVEASESHTAASAMSVILNPGNLKQKIGLESEEITIEELYDGNTYPVPAGELKGVKRKYFTLQDQLELLSEVLETLMDQEADVNKENIKLVAKSRDLDGWDFMDLATGVSPLHLRLCKISPDQASWRDLVRDIGAITLFGSGFGEIMGPTAASSCPYWATLPKGKSYLAICVSDLEQIMVLYGDQTTDPVKLTDNTFWHVSEDIFQPCKCGGNMRGRANSRHSDIVQSIVSKSRGTLLKRPRTLDLGKRVQLEGHGAVIFGDAQRKM
jgi:hypothetical protein